MHDNIIRIRNHDLSFLVSATGLKPLRILIVPIGGNSGYDKDGSTRYHLDASAKEAVRVGNLS